jgi:hypothetical protein
LFHCSTTKLSQLAQQMLPELNEGKGFERSET